MLDELVRNMLLAFLAVLLVNLLLVANIVTCLLVLTCVVITMVGYQRANSIYLCLLHITGSSRSNRVQKKHLKLKTKSKSLLAQYFHSNIQAYRNVTEVKYRQQLWAVVFFKTSYEMYICSKSLSSKQKGSVSSRFL